MAITITTTDAVHQVAEAIRALNTLKPIAAKRVALITKRINTLAAVRAAYKAAETAHCDAAVTYILGPKESYRGGVSNDLISRTVARAFEEFKQTIFYKDRTSAARALTFAKKSAKATRQQIRSAVALLECYLDDIRLTLKQNAEGQPHLPRGAWASRLLTEAEVALLSAMLADGSNVLTDLDDLEISVDQAIEKTYGQI